MKLFFAFMLGMAVMFVVTYLMVWFINRYTNPGVRFRENSEYHNYGVGMMFCYILSSVGCRMVMGGNVDFGFTVWVLLSGVMVWIASIMALIDSDSGSSLFN
jgi:hypothetical protein